MPDARPRTASWPDTLRFLRDTIGPTVAKGIFVRRYSLVALAGRWRLDRRAVERMVALRRTYGPGPLMLPVPGARQAVVLDHAQVRTVLEGAPEPFAPATAEKRLALAHFEPDVSLASRGESRERRRALNDLALESGRPVHSCADRFAAVIADEIGELRARTGDALDWDGFQPAWNRLVRRIVLGDAAAGDEELTGMLTKLRAAANWAMFRPRRRTLLRRFQARLAKHLERAEPGSLAHALTERGGGRAMERHDGPGGEAVDQVTHWLFAFDPGGMATFRALALLASHPGEQRAVRDEVEADAPIGPRSWLRAVMLESLRLWPTTPAILRETTKRTFDASGAGDGANVPVGTNITIFAPYHHRAPHQPSADTFAPALWLESGEGDGEGDGDTATRHVDKGIVPFSGGPAACPARHLVPMVGALTLRALLRGRDVTPVGETPLPPGRPLPATLDNTALAFRLGRPE